MAFITPEEIQKKLKTPAQAGVTQTGIKPIAQDEIKKGLEGTGLTTLPYSPEADKQYNEAVQWVKNFMTLPRKIPVDNVPGPRWSNIGLPGAAPMTSPNTAAAATVTNPAVNTGPGVPGASSIDASQFDWYPSTPKSAAPSPMYAYSPGSGSEAAPAQPDTIFAGSDFQNPGDRQAAVERAASGGYAFKNPDLKALYPKMTGVPGASPIQGPTDMSSVEARFGSPDLVPTEDARTRNNRIQEEKGIAADNAYNRRKLMEDIKQRADFAALDTGVGWPSGTPAAEREAAAGKTAKFLTDLLSGMSTQEQRAGLKQQEINTAGQKNWLDYLSKQSPLTDALTLAKINSYNANADYTKQAKGALASAKVGAIEDKKKRNAALTDKEVRDEAIKLVAANPGLSYPDAVKQVRSIIIPSLDKFLEAARKMNPGVSDADLTAYYNSKYGGQ
jgi:hypothetical protein